jgi:hypothetical protein
LTVDKSSVVEYSLDSNDMSTDDEKSSLLETISREWLVKTQQAGGAIVICELWRSAIVL